MPDEDARALDARVARDVLGCRVIEQLWYDGKIRYECGCTPVIAPPHGRSYRSVDIQGKGLDMQNLKAYSTDISAAWPIVEYLRAQGLFVRVLAGRRYTCVIHSMDDPAKSWSADGDTAPLAICRAALAALSADRTGAIVRS